MQLAKDSETIQIASSAVSNQSHSSYHSMMIKPFSFTKQTERVTKAPSSPLLGVQRRYLSRNQGILSCCLMEGWFGTMWNEFFLSPGKKEQWQQRGKAACCLKWGRRNLETKLNQGFSWLWSSWVGLFSLGKRQCFAQAGLAFAHILVWKGHPSSQLL